jgi:hypothetical protein
MKENRVHVYFKGPAYSRTHGICQDKKCLNSYVLDENYFSKILQSSV